MCVSNFYFVFLSVRFAITSILKARIRNTIFKESILKPSTVISWENSHQVQSDKCPSISKAPATEHVDDHLAISENPSIELENSEWHITHHEITENWLSDLAV